MTDQVYANQARNDFGRVRAREAIARVLSILNPHRNEMLSLHEVRSLVRPNSETYRGMRTIPLARIIGSEGRYRDFNREFLPRHDKLMRRWVSVDVAHYKSISLPPIKVFEIGGVYFVRDGNHRVSVAKTQGAEFIDAEVTSLASEITLSPDMSRDELRQAVIAFERRRFFEETRLDKTRPGCSIKFSEVGRYDMLLDHIREHKWYINLKRTEEIPFEEAAASWYDNVYYPVVSYLGQSGLLSRFPRATEGDLYVYVGRHWSELVSRYGPLFTLEEAAEDFTVENRASLGSRPWRWLWSRVMGLFRPEAPAAQPREGKRPEAQPPEAQPPATEPPDT